MSWVDVLKIITELLPTLAGLIQQILHGGDLKALKPAANDHIETLTKAVQALNGAGIMRLLPPDVGDTLRTAITAHAHASMGLVSAVTKNAEAIRGAMKTLADLEAERTGQPAPAAPTPTPST